MTKQKKRDKRLSDKEKYLNRRKERDVNDVYVQTMFSEAIREQQEQQEDDGGDSTLALPNDIEYQNETDCRFAGRQTEYDAGAGG